MHEEPGKHVSQHQDGQANMTIHWLHATIDETLVICRRKVKVWYVVQRVGKYNAKHGMELRSNWECGLGSACLIFLLFADKLSFPLSIFLILDFICLSTCHLRFQEVEVYINSNTAAECLTSE